MSFLKCLPLPAKLATCTPVCRRHAPDLSCSMRGGNGFPPLTETHFTQKVLPVKFKFNEKAGKLVAYIIYSTPKMPLSFTHGRFFFFFQITLCWIYICLIPQRKPVYHLALPPVKDQTVIPQSQTIKKHILFDIIY